MATIVEINRVQKVAKVRIDKHTIVKARFSVEGLDTRALLPEYDQRWNF
jgi:hypothetical protein